MPFLLAAALMASPAGAQSVDVKGEQQLTTLGAKIDTASTSADSTRVTGRIVEQWKGTTFKFDNTSAPRELTAQDVQTLRQKGLGYGEISILLALTAGQTSGTSAKSLADILALRQTGEGWGQIAKDLGYKNLGSVVRGVKTTDKVVGRVARTEKVAARAERTEHVEKIDRVEKPERMEKPAKPERVERVERPGR